MQEGRAVELFWNAEPWGVNGRAGPLSCAAVQGFELCGREVKKDKDTL